MIECHMIFLLNTDALVEIFTTCIGRGNQLETVAYTVLLELYILYSYRHKSHSCELLISISYTPECLNNLLLYCVAPQLSAYHVAIATYNLGKFYSSYSCLARYIAITGYYFEAIALHVATALVKYKYTCS